MKVLVTGAKGFVGGHVVRFLGSKDLDVVAWSRSKDPPKDIERFARYESHNLMTKPNRLDVDVCIHCAAHTDERGKESDFFGVNLKGTQNLFETVNTKLWINISTASVYPLGLENYCEEDSDYSKITSAYGKSKFKAEQFLETMRKPDQRIVNLRPRAVYGPNDRLLLPKLLKLGRKSRIRLPHSGLVTMSLTHIKNLLHAIELAMAPLERGYFCYNVSDGPGYSLQNVVRSLNEKYHQKSYQFSGLPLSLVRRILGFLGKLHLDYPISKMAFEYLCHDFELNISKIERELGFKPQVSFHEAVEQIVQWARGVDREKLLGADPQLSWLAHRM